MNCERAKELFSELHEGSLDAGLRLKAEEHLRGCAACAHEYEGFKALYSRLGSFPAVEAPADLGEKIARRLDKADWDRKQSAPGRAWRRWAPIAVAAALAAFFVFNRNSDSGIQANPIGIPVSEVRPLSVRIVDGKVHLQLRPSKETVVSVYQGGGDFVTMPPLDAKLLRSDKVAAMSRYNVPLDVSGGAVGTIWVMTSNPAEPVMAVFLGSPTSSTGDRASGNIAEVLQVIAYRYRTTIAAQLKDSGTPREVVLGDEFSQDMGRALEGTGLTFSEADGVVVVK